MTRVYRPQAPRRTLHLLDAQYSCDVKSYMIRTLFKMQSLETQTLLRSHSLPHDARPLTRPVGLNISTNKTRASQFATAVHGSKSLCIPTDAQQGTYDTEFPTDQTYLNFAKNVAHRHHELFFFGSRTCGIGCRHPFSDSLPITMDSLAALLKW